MAPTARSSGPKVDLAVGVAACAGGATSVDAEDVVTKYFYYLPLFLLFKPNLRTLSAIGSGHLIH